MCLVILCIFEMTLHSILSNWFRFAIINLVNVILVLLLLVWKRQPLTLSWLVVGCAIVILGFAPSFLQSSFAILTLYLCYTLLPLQLRPSAVAALAVTISALILHLYNEGTELRKVNILLIICK